MTETNWVGWHQPQDIATCMSNVCAMYTSKFRNLRLMHGPNNYVKLCRNNYRCLGITKPDETRKLNRQRIFSVQLASYMSKILLFKF